LLSGLLARVVTGLLCSECCFCRLVSCLLTWLLRGLLMFMMLCWRLRRLLSLCRLRSRLFRRLLGRLLAKLFCWGLRRLLSRLL